MNDQTLDERGARNPSLPEPTVAAFAPGQRTARGTPRSVLIHQKSPLLVATPPIVTKALAHSHPFLLPLNYLLGLLSWNGGDAWESFLLVAAFWFTILYGDYVVRFAGPVILLAVLMAAMYSRRYSPLSSNGQQKRKRAASESQERKSLDEIVSTLQTFTNRCDILLDPFLRLTEFLSTQSTATSATTRPALTSMFIRLLAVTPVWILLTLPPLRIITTQHVLLVLGTIGMTWHSRPARASRAILWRSRTVRYIFSVVTGLDFPSPPLTSDKSPPPLPPRRSVVSASALGSKGESPGVRFTFAIYENQRRWVLLGFTSNTFLHERQAWTDEHLNEVPEKDSFELPETNNETTKWRWVEGSVWKVDPAWTDDAQITKGARDKEGWTYYDNKWSYGSKIDDWSKWTRRRRWVRDAELVEVPPEDIAAVEADVLSVDGTDYVDGDSISTAVKKKGWFGKRRLTNEKVRVVDKSDIASMTGSGDTGNTSRSRDDPAEDLHTPLRYRETQWDRSIGDGLAEGLS